MFLTSFIGVTNKPSASPKWAALGTIYNIYFMWKYYLYIKKLNMNQIFA